MSLRIGDPYDVPGYGRGVIVGFQGRREGLRMWTYIRVRINSVISALVPIYEGEVLQ
jgi:hypothetical protein